ncbi:688_t:CDS:2 [Diversispora eburnea]|uniref:688_t:CDS:1 n=1 Tax=Diversispora eburnea TaxID=1213867 RepID=A0A9N9B9X8_9GLOM|nr:688_t:CDS:2 [Diversispora eburnea]
MFAKSSGWMITFFYTSTKTVSQTPKRYKCEVCQKRFTRPSSLTTHSYTHTGEKPFKCPVEGCGRPFSVMSNLRRHQKVHKK